VSHSNVQICIKPWIDGRLKLIVIESKTAFLSPKAEETEPKNQCPPPKLILSQNKMNVWIRKSIVMPFHTKTLL
jgi:hypothetical protein